MGVIYVLEHDTHLSLNDGTLKVMRKKTREVRLTKPLIHVDEIVLLANASLTPQLLKRCAREGIGVHFLSQNGSYIARLTGTPAKNAPLRIAQYRVYFSPEAKLNLAKSFIRGKLKNSVVFLRRNGADSWSVLREAIKQLDRVRDIGPLRGVEGSAADVYFRALANLFPIEFAFTERSKRPPRDPANSLLSLAYTFLSKEVHSALEIAGFDPYVGYLHEIRYGRISLALDLMEEFRSIISDSVVLSLLNNRRITLEDFDDADGAPRLRREAWPKFLKAWEERMNDRIRHPLLGRRMSYRRILLAQARILGKHLLGEMEEYVPFAVR